MNNDDYINDSYYWAERLMLMDPDLTFENLFKLVDNDFEPSYKNFKPEKIKTIENVIWD